MHQRTSQTALLLSLSVLLSACSLRTLAVSKIGDTIASGGSTFASDDDPELIAQALPFSLKLIESLLAETPKHRGLLLAATRGYTQYAYAFVQLEGDEVESEDLEQAMEIRARAARLYLRARDFGLRGLDARHAGIASRLRSDSLAATRELGKDDVPLAYWTAAAWGAAISLSKTDPDLIADQPIVEALVDRALSLDEEFDSGAIHAFLISYEPARQGADGQASARCRQHFARAVELTGGQLASPYISLAESASVPDQNRAEFDESLHAALAIDPDARIEWRLANIVAQRRAQWLLEHADNFFIPEEAQP